MTRLEFMVCPLCSRSQPIMSKRWTDPEIRFDYWDKKSALIQIREGGERKQVRQELS